MDEARILLIEDDPDIREGVRILLESEGYAVDEAADGETGLMLAGEETDLVILDVMMPGLSGLKVCQELRKVSNVPVLFLTARAQESDKLIGLMAGGDDYLTKLPGLPGQGGACHPRGAGLPERRGHPPEHGREPGVGGRAGGPALRPGVSAAAAAHGAPRGHLLRPDPLRAGVGGALFLQLRRDGDGPHPQAAGKGGVRPPAAQTHRHRVGKGVSL